MSKKALDFIMIHAKKLLAFNICVHLSKIAFKRLNLCTLKTVVFSHFTLMSNVGVRNIGSAGVGGFGSETEMKMKCIVMQEARDALSKLQTVTLFRPIRSLMNGSFFILEVK